MGCKAHATFLLRFLGLAGLISQGLVMTNNAFIYRRPSKWPIAAALTAAVLIHLSAVAIAFHQESPAMFPAATDPTAIGGYFADDPPTAPPEPDIFVPPPTPSPATDFIE